MRGHLLDTNVVSEWMKPHPNPGVIEWLDNADEDTTYLSVLSIGEIRRGVDRLSDSRRRDQLARWLTDDLAGRFVGRLLSVDLATANAWGRLRARTEQIGRTMPGTDALLAATAESHDLEIVTRNVADFAASGVPVHNPWTD